MSPVKQNKTPKPTRRVKIQDDDLVVEVVKNSLKAETLEAKLSKRDASPTALLPKGMSQVGDLSPIQEPSLVNLDIGGHNPSPGG